MLRVLKMFKKLTFVLSLILFSSLVFAGFGAVPAEQVRERIASEAKVRNAWVTSSDFNDGLPVLKEIPKTSKLYRVNHYSGGLAVLTTAPFDFAKVRIMVGKVVKPNLSQNQLNSLDVQQYCIDAAKTKCVPLVNTGVLFLDSEKYRLSEIDFDFETDSLVSQILNKEGASVGSLSIFGIDKKKGETGFVGKMIVEGKTYDLYLNAFGHSLAPKKKEILPSRVSKKCSLGKDLLPVSSGLVQCHSRGGSVVLEKDEYGCPLKPKCVLPNGSTQDVQTVSPTTVSQSNE